MRVQVGEIACGVIRSIYDDPENGGTSHHSVA